MFSDKLGERFSSWHFLCNWRPLCLLNCNHACTTHTKIQSDTTDVAVIIFCLSVQLKQALETSYEVALKKKKKEKENRLTLSLIIHENCFFLIQDFPRGISWKLLIKLRSFWAPINDILFGQKKKMCYCCFFPSRSKSNLVLLTSFEEKQQVAWWTPKCFNK